MPYIIETQRTDVAAHGGTFQNALSRTAVATLDEAWAKLPPGIPDTTLVRERFDLETVGECQFGPLPDGTVIEVRRVGLGTLAARAGFAQYSDERSSADIISAFNAA